MKAILPLSNRRGDADSKPHIAYMSIASHTVGRSNKTMLIQNNGRWPMPFTSRALLSNANQVSDSEWHRLVRCDQRIAALAMVGVNFARVGVAHAKLVRPNLHDV